MRPLLITLAGSCHSTWVPAEEEGLHMLCAAWSVSGTIILCARKREQGHTLGSVAVQEVVYAFYQVLLTRNRVEMDHV